MVVAHCRFNLHLSGDRGNRAPFSCVHWLYSFVKCVFLKAILLKVCQYICVVFCLNILRCEN